MQRKGHPCSLTSRRGSHSGRQHQPSLPGHRGQDADSKSLPAWALAPCSTLCAQTQPPASQSVQQGQPPRTWAFPSAQTLTQRLAACIQTSRSASIGATHTGPASGSASWAGHMWPSRSWCPCSPTMETSSQCQQTPSGSSAPQSTRFVAANRPAAAGAAHLYPSRAMSTRTLQQGGIALVDIPAQVTALQAKIIDRLLKPERAPWKAYFSSWLAMPLTAEQKITTPAQSQHLWQLERGLLFFSFPTQSIQAPRYVVAFL